MRCSRLEPKPVSETIRDDMTGLLFVMAPGTELCECDCRADELYLLDVCIVGFCSFLDVGSGLKRSCIVGACNAQSKEARYMLRVVLNNTLYRRR